MIDGKFLDFLFFWEGLHNNLLFQHIPSWFLHTLFWEPLICCQLFCVPPEKFSDGSERWQGGGMGWARGAAPAPLRLTSTAVSVPLIFFYSSRFSIRFHAKGSADLKKKETGKSSLVQLPSPYFTDTQTKAQRYWNSNLIGTVELKTLTSWTLGYRSVTIP